MERVSCGVVFVSVFDKLRLVILTLISQANRDETGAQTRPASRVRDPIFGKKNMVPKEVKN